MGAVKKSRETEQQFYYQPNAVLSAQERQALSLVWQDDSDEKPAQPQNESDITHCAELGYN